MDELTATPTSVCDFKAREAVIFINLLQKTIQTIQPLETLYTKLTVPGMSGVLVNVCLSCILVCVLSRHC